MNPLDDPTISNFLANVLTNLAEAIAQGVGRRVRAKMSGPEERQAVERCTEAGLRVLALSVCETVPDAERRDRTLEIWATFFRDEEVAGHLAPLVQGEALRGKELGDIFADLGFDEATLPGPPFAEAMEQFKVAFIAQALWEPTLQGIVQAGHLVALREISQQQLDTMRALLERSQTGAPRIWVDKAEGEEVVIGEKHVHHHYGPPDRSEPLKRAYLQALFAQLRPVALGDIDLAAADADAQQLQLDAVYTALLTDQRAEKKRRERGAELHDGPPLSALALLNQEKRLVLVGDPGSGKSTFVSYVALCLAGEALGRPEATIAHLTAPLPDEKGEDEKQPQPWSHGTMLPFRVVLREFAARGLPDAGMPIGAGCLWEYIATELARMGHGEVAEVLHRCCQEEPTLLLLDGLDEVPEANQRREQLREAILAFARSFPKCRILVTSRPYAYQQAVWKLPGFAEGRLLPFHTGQVRRFVRRWYAHYAALRGLTPDEGRSGAALLVRAIERSQRLGELAARPLLLTLMASLHAWRGGSLPEKREALYHDAVELLLHRWEGRRVVRDAAGNEAPLPSLREWLKIENRDEIRRLLEQLAYDVHKEGGLEDTADIPAQELSHRLMKLGKRQGVNAQHLLDHLEQRTGLLVARGAETYSFPHRTFQEYLAACWLTKQNPKEAAKLAGEDPNRWREVILLAAARASSSDWQGWGWVQALCPTAPEKHPDDAGRAWRALFAGQVVTESLGRTEPGEEHEATRERVRDWQLTILRGSTLPARERALAGDTLATLGDPRFDPDHWYLPREPLLGFVEIPAGPFLMGSDPKRDRETRTEEQPQHELTLPTYWLARYPVTVAQWRAFVQASGFKSGDPRSLHGVANHPVVWVSWYDALAYCVWLTEQLRGLALARLSAGGLAEKLRRFWEWFASGVGVVTLPSEPEWEKAARGTSAEGVVTVPSEPEWEKAARDQGRRVYPWGDAFGPERANLLGTGIRGTSAVGAFADGSSVYGLLDMSGNVWEWTRSVYTPYPYPSGGVALEQRESLTASDSVARVLRGASWALNEASIAGRAFRLNDKPRGGRGTRGFRVASPSAPIPFPDR